MSSSDSEASGEESDTENALMDMQLLKAFRNKPITRRRKIGEVDASDDESNSDEEDSSSDNDSEGDSEEEEEGGEEVVEEVDEEEDEEEEDIEIEEFIGKKGTQLFRCRFCPEKGPFKSLEDIKAFMTGKFYLKVVKRVLKLDKIAKRDAAVGRQASENKEDKERVEAKRQAKNDKLKEKIRVKKVKKTSNLTEDQIEKRKQRFKLKKQRREEKRNKNVE